MNDRHCHKKKENVLEQVKISNHIDETIIYLIGKRIYIYENELHILYIFGYEW